MRDEKEAARKPYVAPVLKTYGSLTDITNAVGSMSKNADGGAMSMQKTQ